MAKAQLNLYEAKTQLSSLVDRAAAGEVIVIAKSGKPMAQLTPVPAPKRSSRLPFGQNLMGIQFFSDKWEDDLPAEMFEDPEGDALFRKG